MISTKGRYAVRMLIDLCERGDGACATLRDVAQRQQISEKYLQRIAKTLVGTGLVVGASGRGGGYRLARPASQISVLEVLEAAEGTLAPVSCLESDAPPCARAPGCKTLPMWNRYYSLMREFFGSLTIAGLEAGTFEHMANAFVGRSSNKLRIRPFRDSDEQTVLSWCTDEQTHRFWTAGVLGEYPITPKKFQNTANTMRFVGVDGNEVVGFFILRYPQEEDFDTLRIGFVIVDPKRRGQGIGKDMLRLGLNYAFGCCNAKRVTLVVFDDNEPARACYSSIGFVATGNRESYVIANRECSCAEMEYRKQDQPIVG